MWYDIVVVRHFFVASVYWRLVQCLGCRMFKAAILNVFLRMNQSGVVTAFTTKRFSFSSRFVFDSFSNLFCFFVVCIFRTVELHLAKRACAYRIFWQCGPTDDHHDYKKKTPFLWLFGGHDKTA